MAFGLRTKTVLADNSAECEGIYSQYQKKKKKSEFYE